MKKEWKNDIKVLGYLILIMLLLFSSLPLSGVFADDDIRDVIKGHVFYEEIPGFVNGGKDLEKKVLGAVTAWCDNEEDEFRPKSCAQIINYVSAHDNFTLWDKLVLSMHGGYGVNN